MPFDIWIFESPNHLVELYQLRKYRHFGALWLLSNITVC